MATSVRTKVRKKQHTFATTQEDGDRSRKLERAAMELEDAVFHVLEADRGDMFNDVDFLYWNRKLKNIAMQVSLALTEYRGPRRFHYHYRHDPKDHDHLCPVAGPSGQETLMRVCREALMNCAEMVGVQDKYALADRSRMEQSIRLFLLACQPARVGNH